MPLLRPAYTVPCADCLARWFEHTLPGFTYGVMKPGVVIARAGRFAAVSIEVKTNGRLDVAGTLGQAWSRGLFIGIAPFSS